MRIPFLSKFIERRTVSLDAKIRAFLLGEDLGIQSNAGVNISEYNAMTSTAVYACVKVLSETIASLPLPLYRRLERGKEKATYHPLYFLLHDMPNPDMTSFTFRETLMSHLLLWGNAYAQVIRDERGHVVELWPLLPDRMSAERDLENGKLVYKYLKDGQQILLNQEQVLHIPGLGFDGIKGYSPIHMAREAIGLALATEEFGSKFFANDARPGGILEHPGVVNGLAP